MATIIKSTSRPAKRIKAANTVSSSQVDAAVVAKAFGARKTGVGTGQDTNAFSLLQLRGEIEGMLQSTGGRPALSAASARVKIPKIQSDWNFIEAVASHASNLPRRPSPAQIAAVMLHMAVSRFSADEIAEELKREKAA